MLKCLACGHDNEAGEVFCAQCVSSLNLTVCRACDAMNARSAECCYSCGAKLIAEDQASAPPEPDPLVQLKAPEKSLPAQLSPPRGRVLGDNAMRLSAVVLSIAGSAAALAYYFSDGTLPAAIQPRLIALAPAAEANAAPQSYVDIPPTADKAADAPPVATTISAEAPSRSVTPVTHTRGVAASPAAADAPPKQALPQATRVKAASEVPLTRNVPLKPSGASIAPVTHTRAAAGASRAAAEPPKDKIAPPHRVAAERRSEARNEKAANCAPGVAAIGLCTSQ